MSTIPPPTSSSSLAEELKYVIVDTLKLEGVRPEEIQNDAPLFGEGLGLDSIDALEIGIAIKKKYGVDFDVKDKNLQKNFASINALASFIEGAAR